MVSPPPPTGKESASVATDPSLAFEIQEINRSYERYSSHEFFDIRPQPAAHSRRAASRRLHRERGAAGRLVAACRFRGARAPATRAERRTLPETGARARTDGLRPFDSSSAARHTRPDGDPAQRPGDLRSAHQHGKPEDIRQRLLRRDADAATRRSGFETCAKHARPAGRSGAGQLCRDAGPIRGRHRTHSDDPVSRLGGLPNGFQFQFFGHRASGQPPDRRCRNSARRHSADRPLLRPRPCAVLAGRQTEGHGRCRARPCRPGAKGRHDHAGIFRCLSRGFGIRPHRVAANPARPARGAKGRPADLSTTDRDRARDNRDDLAQAVDGDTGTPMVAGADRRDSRTPRRSPGQAPAGTDAASVSPRAGRRS